MQDLTPSTTLDNLAAGAGGFRRIEGDTVYNARDDHHENRFGTGRVGFVYALTDVTFGASCAVDGGDAPAEDDVIPAGTVLPGRFPVVHVKDGVAYCYPG